MKGKPFKIIITKDAKGHVELTCEGRSDEVLSGLSAAYSEVLAELIRDGLDREEAQDKTFRAAMSIIEILEEVEVTPE